MTIQQWRTYSIRIAPRKHAALQAKFPLTLNEWVELIAWLEKTKPELVERNPHGPNE